MNRPRPCVRCAKHPREGETFLCRDCLEDPRTTRERLEAELLAQQRGTNPRLIVIARHHWAGGW